MKFIKINKFKVTISGEGSDEINLGYFNQHISYLNENPKNRISELKNFNKIYKNNHSLRYLKNYLHHLLSAHMASLEIILKKQVYRTDEIIKNYVFKYKLPKLLHWQDVVLRLELSQDTHS